MKVLILFFSVFTLSYAYSQVFQIELKIDSENQKQLFESKELLLNNIEINDVKECYPKAKNPELRKFHCIEVKGTKKDIDSFFKVKNKLNYQILDSGVVDACANPQSINDVWIVNNWANNYAMEIIEANCAWSISKGDSSVVVGVADTQFDTAHQDLSSHFVYINNNPTGGHPHGTRVAGCVSPINNNSIGIAGIGYNTSLAVHSFPHTPSGGYGASDARVAIWNLYLAGVDIINLSATNTGLNTLAVQEMVDDGVVLVVSAGNFPNSTSHSAIANIPGVVLVSSVNQDNSHGSTNHAHNQWIDVCAPGINVTTTDTSDWYKGVGGTSFAAPIVAGTIALMKSVNKCLTPAELELVLELTCDTIADQSLFPGQLGAGRINAYQAVKRTGTAYIQNETINSNKHIAIGYQIFVGYNVTSELPTGNVLLTTGKDMILEARNEVTLDKGFTMEAGSTLEINVDPNLVLSCY